MVAAGVWPAAIMFCSRVPRFEPNAKLSTVYAALSRTASAKTLINLSENLSSRAEDVGSL